MMNILRKPENFWPMLWTGLLLVLLAVLLAEVLLDGSAVDQPARGRAKVMEARLLPPYAAPPEAMAGAETVARPLFVPTRRPAPVLASSAAAMRKGQFVLTGVTILPDAAYAFLHENASGKTHSVRKGNMVNGISVDAVEPRRVVLRQGEETEELPLNIRVPARIAVAPAATAAAPRTAPPGPSAPAQGSAPAAATPPAAGGGPAISPTPAPAGTPPAAQTPQGPVSGRRRPWITPQ